LRQKVTAEEDERRCQGCDAGAAAQRRRIGHRRIRQAIGCLGHLGRGQQQETIDQQGHGGQDRQPGESIIKVKIKRDHAVSPCRPEYADKEKAGHSHRGLSGLGC